MEEPVTCYFEDPENLTVVCNGVLYKEEDIIEPSDFVFWLYLILYGVLVCFAGESGYMYTTWFMSNTWYRMLGVARIGSG